MMRDWSPGDSALIQVDRLKAEGDRMARILCTLLGALERQGALPDDPELRTWWTEHKAYDRSIGRSP
jgi:hypothetical protein